MSEYQAQLIAVQAKLAKDPENEELLSLQSDLMELIELSGDFEEEQNLEINVEKKDKDYKEKSDHDKTRASSSKVDINPDFRSNSQSSTNLVDKDISNISSKRPSEAETLAKKKEKNRKKKAKLRERIKEQLDIAESEKQSWQSFANKKGLKGVTKKSIFASPCSVSGKVGVGTNGIADVPSATELTAAKRKY